MRCIKLGSSVGWSRVRSDDGLTLETSAFQSLCGGQFTLSTPLINQIFVHHSPTDAAPQFLQKLIPFTLIGNKILTCLAVAASIEYEPFPQSIDLEKNPRKFAEPTRTNSLPVEHQLALQTRDWKAVELKTWLMLITEDIISSIARWSLWTFPAWMGMVALCDIPIFEGILG